LPLPFDRRRRQPRSASGSQGTGVIDSLIGSWEGHLSFINLFPPPLLFGDQWGDI
jgi:hypothetical protein